VRSSSPLLIQRQSHHPLSRPLARSPGGKAGRASIHSERERSVGEADEEEKWISKRLL